MKGILFFILLIYWSPIYGSNSDSFKIDTLSSPNKQIREVKLPKSNESSTDTINLELESGKELILPIIPDISTRVVFVKEKNYINIINYLMTFLTVLFGIGIKWYIDSKSNKKRITKAGLTWLAELRSTEEPIKTQIDNLKSFKSSMDDKEHIVAKLYIVSSINGERFKSLNKDDLTQYVKSQYKKQDIEVIIKITNGIYSYVSTLSYLNETLRTEFIDYRTDISKSTKSLNKNFQSLMVAISDFAVSLELKDEELNEDPRYKPILNLLNEHIMPIWNKGFDPFKLEVDFLNPLVKILYSLRIYDKTRPLSIVITNCLNDIREIAEKKEYFMGIIKYMLDNYNTQLDNLNNVTYNIERKKRVDQ